MTGPSYELVELQAHSSFRCFRSSCETFADEHPFHFHPAYELTWIIRSSGTRYVGDSVENYTPGDLVLSGPNLPHCWREDRYADEGNAPEWIVVQFEPSCFGAGFLELPEAQPLRDLLLKSSAGLAFDAEAAIKVGPLMHELTARSGLARLVMLLDILDALSQFAARSLAGVDYHRINAVDRTLVERLERIQAYISANLADDISQVEIAAQLGMRPASFSKFFRVATGRTFTSLVKLLRIKEACHLLTTTDARITDIALDCGYRHTSHFDQHFQELKGMSPTAYRRRRHDLGGRASHRRFTEISR